MTIYKVISMINDMLIFDGLIQDFNNMSTKTLIMYWQYVSIVGITCMILSRSVSNRNPKP